MNTRRLTHFLAVGLTGLALISAASAQTPPPPPAGGPPPPPRAGMRARPPAPPASGLRPRRRVGPVRRNGMAARPGNGRGLRGRQGNGTPPVTPPQPR